MTSTWGVRPAPVREAPRALIERAHDERIAGNATDPRLDLVRPLVRASWERSIASLVGAEGAPRLELMGDELERYRAEHPLAGTVETIRHLLLPGDAARAGVVVAVGDAAGRLLWVDGDSGVRSLTGDMGFVPGANWAEDHVGTSAPGTALALERTVQIAGAEHFNRLVHPWSCTAAPVRDLETGRVLGILDVTGGDEAASSHAQMLVEATVRAVESELLVARLRARHEAPRPKRRVARPATRPTLSVLGRDRALLDRGGMAPRLELGQRHAEILLMLTIHRQGLAAERLAELVYGAPAVGTLRPEMVRLRRRLLAEAPGIDLESRPYRLTGEIETDVQHVIALIDRGAHRLALAAFRGDVLPDSTSPGVEEVRDTVRATLRDAILTEAGLDVLLAYIDADVGAADEEALRQCLAMLPPRSPRRTGIVARIERLESVA